MVIGDQKFGILSLPLSGHQCPPTKGVKQIVSVSQVLHKLKMSGYLI